MNDLTCFKKKMVAANKKRADRKLVSYTRCLILILFLISGPFQCNKWIS